MEYLSNFSSAHTRLVGGLNPLSATSFTEKHALSQLNRLSMPTWYAFLRLIVGIVLCSSLLAFSIFLIITSLFRNNFFKKYSWKKWLEPPYTYSQGTAGTALLIKLISLGYELGGEIGARIVVFVSGALVGWLGLFLTYCIWILAREQ